MSAQAIWMQTAKEVVRHCLHVTRSEALLHTLRRLRGIEVGHLAASGRFDAIYEKGVWSQWGEGAPSSGVGSSLQATDILRQRLPGLLEQLETRTLLDIGCGDFTWMSTVTLPQVKYIGADVVAPVVEENRATYGGETREFVCLDAVRDPLPQADTVLLREILFHLSFSDIFGLLANLKTMRPRYLLATTDSVTRFNADIRTGDYRALNLGIRPFRFPPPLVEIVDDSIMPLRRMAAWELDRIP